MKALQDDRAKVVRAWRTPAWILVGAIAVIALGGCREATKPPSPPPPSPPVAAVSTNIQIYQVKGIVHEVQPERKKVKIAHEEIPGYMTAMTMLLDVKETKELDGLKPGDSIAFRMLVTDDDGWIDQIKVLHSSAPVTNTPPEGFQILGDLEPLEVGDALPDYRFTNELGRVMRLHDFKGRALAFTFIFTRCPFPNFCPRMSSHFTEAQRLLQSRPGGPTNWHFLSITIDPEFDTPAALKLYARRYEPDPARWNFVTGAPEDIRALGYQFTLQFWKEGGTINHNLRTVVVDAHGRVQKIIPENEWTPAELAEEVVQAATAPPAKAESK